ncbi:MAG: ClbS/DfsB family four-helix bundle protein [Chloroflexi bacterium]|nr:ClbS/DfsB family four-helix bundle protein [Chloroflexota bacterium]MCI0576459.1 ClbS/DfsB family four-helix bundle protein [Chloroflexota bacterium]MCI0649565.1 ClbS/DfsB family four-helix bundle protein [Chloroflexota bacterium]MCI0729359.1 ClbS/DfsB family four-helix bundle protein [Chloroflexota bacterium]
MDRVTFLETLKAGREEWEALLAQVDEARWSEPGVEGDWSLKDVVAHVSWHEREMIGVLDARALAGSEWWNLPTDERNALIYEANRDRPLAEVQVEAKETYARLWAAVQTLSDEELNDPGRFAGMFLDWAPWKLLAENTYEHYQQHVPGLRAWIRR